jgi:Glycoside-hydrolase family GH114/Bacterial SH3 domain
VLRSLPRFCWGLPSAATSLSPRDDTAVGPKKHKSAHCEQAVAPANGHETCSSPSMMFPRVGLSLSFLAATVALSVGCAATGAGDDADGPIDEAQGLEADDSRLSSSGPTYEAGTTLKTTKNLNLRAAGSRTAAVLKQMSSGTEVTVWKSSGSNGWVAISAGGKKGYAHTDYLLADAGGSTGGGNTSGGSTGPSDRPTPDTVWHLDAENPVNLNANADWFDIDLFDNLETNYIATLHSKGRKVVCYFSAGSSERWRPDFASLPSAGIGKKMNGWDENWLDVRNAGVRNVMKKRLDLAKNAGCDGVDPDNVDGYANATGFSISADDQLDYNRFLAREAHARGMVAGLKNDVDQIPDLVSDFDFQINEQCFKYNECANPRKFIAAGKSVLNIEYGDVSGDRTQICPTANSYRFFTILSDADRINGTYTKCR